MIDFLWILRNHNREVRQCMGQYCILVMFWLDGDKLLNNNLSIFKGIFKPLMMY